VLQRLDLKRTVCRVGTARVIDLVSLTSYTVPSVCHSSRRITADWRLATGDALAARSAQFDPRLLLTEETEQVTSVFARCGEGPTSTPTNLYVLQLSFLLFVGCNRTAAVHGEVCPGSNLLRLSAQNCRLQSATFTRSTGRITTRNGASSTYSLGMLPGAPNILSFLMIFFSPSTQMLK
jgi:hypothetical protein